MKKNLSLYILPEKLENQDFIRSRIQKKLQLKTKFDFIIRKRSIDARKRPVQYLLNIDVYLNESTEEEVFQPHYKDTRTSKKSVIIIGAGPAGYFAALKLIEHGIKVIIFERGKDVQSRRKDLRQVQQFGIVNPHSNYCFGEGGAGTYSDGKLYTRSKKRGNVYSILQKLVHFGASSDILIDAHPHIGSNKLPSIIETIRKTILHFGGEIHFDSFVTDIIIKDQKAMGVEVNQSEKHFADSIILASGHSARDIFNLLAQKRIAIKAKEFALGLRIEHPQKLIDKIQYGLNDRPSQLPASRYALNCQIEERGVYSFCMCPGGFIVPASTAANEQVINGMSLSRRDSKFANSGIVTTITLEDIPDYRKNYGELASMRFQQDIEKAVFNAGGDESQRVPAQRMIDFIENRKSIDLPESSYIPKLNPYPLHELLPAFIVRRLQKALLVFAKKMPSYLSNDATLLAVESRTSSPVQIPRKKDSLEHIEIQKLYPCGEGAAYAGGIISAAMDGEAVASKIAEHL